MKKIFIAIITAIGIFGATSCSDMLETESGRHVTDPSLNKKTDSISYAFGIMQAMQQLADQYYLQNEMRGDLVTPTSKATIHLQNLSNFSAGAENKYDSVYLYYKVINNCNYFLQARDTTLKTGTENVTINEYVNVAAFRAWAYIQLINQYGDVPYVTKPLTTISEINAATAKMNYKEILANEIQYMESLKSKYSDAQLDAPYYEGYGVAPLIGSLNLYSNGNNRLGNKMEKAMETHKCFVPFNVVLGDLYLENGQYEQAAKCYFDYLNYKSMTEGIAKIGNGTGFTNNARYDRNDRSEFSMPTDYNTSVGNKDLKNSNGGWDRIFCGEAGWPTSSEVISYIPMAVNYTRGQTTDVPSIFGYDYYASDYKQYSKYQLYAVAENEEVQVQPSDEYMTMAKTAPYYYFSVDRVPGSANYQIKSEPLGDGRCNFIVSDKDAETNIYVQKPSTGYFYLYRNSTIYMHLAEALNRMNEPTLAFAILKNGLNTGISQLVDTCAYEYEDGHIKMDNGEKVLRDKTIPADYYFIKKESYMKLVEGSLPFFADANKLNFTNTNKEIIGMHFHGAGAVEDLASPYTYKAIVEARIDEIRSRINYDPTAPYEEAEYVNAMEDILCDEYAMEFAFEGRRFSDLLRLARHKNLNSPYGAGYGDTWLSEKLKNKKAGINTQNCFLPFK